MPEQRLEISGDSGVRNRGAAQGRGRRFHGVEKDEQYRWWDADVTPALKGSAEVTDGAPRDTGRVNRFRR